MNPSLLARPEFRRAISRILATALVFSVLFGIGGVIYWLATPTEYRSSAIIQIRAEEFKTEGVAESEEKVLDIPYVADALIASFESELLASRTAAKLGSGYSTESVKNQLSAKTRKTGGSLVKIAGYAGSAKEAQRILQTALEERLAIEKERSLSFMTPLLRGVDAQISDLERSISSNFQKISEYAAEKPDLEQKRIAGAAEAGIEASVSEITIQIEDARIKLEKLKASVALIEKGNCRVEEIQNFGESSDIFADTKRSLAAQFASLAALRARFAEDNVAVVASKAQIDETKRSLVRSLRELEAQVETRLAGLTEARELLNKRSQAMKMETKGLLDRDATYNTLISGKDALTSAFQQLLFTKHQLLITSQMQPLTIQILDGASLPARPYITKKLIVLAAALVVGFLLGTGIGVLRSRLFYIAFIDDQK